jgi:hypothetical protein
VTHPLAFVLLKHQNALRALTPDAVDYPIDIGNLVSSRSLAIHTVEHRGWIWPAILDEEFPPAVEGGLKYDRVTIKFVKLDMKYSFC